MHGQLEYHKHGFGTLGVQSPQSSRSHRGHTQCSLVPPGFPGCSHHLKSLPSTTPTTSSEILTCVLAEFSLILCSWIKASRSRLIPFSCPLRNNVNTVTSLVAILRIRNVHPCLTCAVHLHLASDSRYRVQLILLSVISSSLAPRSNIKAHANFWANYDSQTCRLGRDPAN